MADRLKKKGAVEDEAAKGPAGKARPAGKKAAKGLKKAAKGLKKAAAKAAAKKTKPAPKRARRARKGGKKTVAVVRRAPARAPAPTILVVGAKQQEPVWVRYSQMTPARPSRKPGVPTDIRTGNLVGWRTESGKERVGVVRSFVGDAAAVDVAGRTEIIRISRLGKLADKIKEM
ncbi:MAG: hypothetical protein PHN82_06870 [bacterium]|nr:hypothetical protein [bacterium]